MDVSCQKNQQAVNMKTRIKLMVLSYVVGNKSQGVCWITGKLSENTVFLLT